MVGAWGWIVAGVEYFYMVFFDCCQSFFKAQWIVWTLDVHAVANEKYFFKQNPFSCDPVKTRFDLIEPHIVG